MSMKEPLKLGLILGVIALVISVMLAFANEMTAGIIEKRQQDDTQAALRQVLSAQTYEKTEKPASAGSDVDDVYIAKNGGDVLGYCVKVGPNGYGGEISMIVGVEKDGSVSGVSITEMNETPGLGTHAKEDKFINQYPAFKAPYKVSKDGGEIQAISGATITSRAVTNGVNQAVETGKLLGGGAK